MKSPKRWFSTDARSSNLMICWSGFHFRGCGTVDLVTPQRLLGNTNYSYMFPTSCNLLCLHFLHSEGDKTCSILSQMLRLYSIESENHQNYPHTGVMFRFLATKNYMCNAYQYDFCSPVETRMKPIARELHPRSLINMCAETQNSGVVDSSC